jgi:hypothetical protein
MSSDEFLGCQELVGTRSELVGTRENVWGDALLLCA